MKFDSVTQKEQRGSRTEGVKNRGITSSFLTSVKIEDPSVCDSSVWGEKRKIKYGKAHFDEFDGVEYRQVAKVSDLN